MLPSELLGIAEQVVHKAPLTSSLIATAESCTGGLIAASITEIAGSSEIFDRGFVTYSNESKNKLLGVPKSLLEEYGAVSKECAIAMSEGALIHSNATLTVAVTGIAGPGGGTNAKPVGLVYIASAKQGITTQHQEHHFSGSRSAIRYKTTEAALKLLLKQLSI